jgi:hypothetical protein
MTIGVEANPRVSGWVFNLELATNIPDPRRNVSRGTAGYTVYILESTI